MLKIKEIKEIDKQEVLIRTIQNQELLEIRNKLRELLNDKN